jgi:hypothetical protein
LTAVERNSFAALLSAWAKMIRVDLSHHEQQNRSEAA